MTTFEEVYTNVTAHQELYKKYLNFTGLELIYGLYRQGKDGDAPESPETSNLSNIDLFKWRAWDAQRGKPQEDAQQEYIDFVMSTGLLSVNEQTSIQN